MTSAIYIPNKYKFYSNGEPTFGITSIEACIPGVDVEDHIYIHSMMLDYIIPDTIEQLNKLLYITDDIFHSLKKLSIEAHDYVKYGKKIDEHGYTVAAVSISNGIHNVEPLNNYHPQFDESIYEYDVHSCVLAMMNYQYYFSNKKSNHQCDSDIVNPLCDVTSVMLRKTKNGYSMHPVDNGGIYLCSRINRNSYVLKKLINKAKRLIEHCYTKYDYDISRLVYGIILGSIYISMPTPEFRFHLNISRALMELSSLRLIHNNDISGLVFMDSVHVNSLLPEMETTENLPISRIKPIDKVIGKRYIKRRRRLVKNIVYNEDNFYSPEHFVLDVVNLDSGDRGWYSYSPKRLKISRLFHIDIHNAYTSLYFKYTGKIINKREFGKIKCVDIYLYQKIRKEVEMKSRDILSSFENNLMYWKTDGGITLCENDDFVVLLKTKFPDILVDEIIDTIPMYIHHSIDIPKQLSRTDIFKTRLFAYKVITRDSIKIVYANQFEKYKDIVLDHNGMIGLRMYNSNLLSEVLTNRKD